MAVQTLPVSIGSPTELIAPRSASVSNVSRSNSGAFKTELHNASESNSVRKNHDLAKTAEKRSSESTVNEKSASSSNISGQNSSLNAKDTNAAKASEQQLQTTTTTKNNEKEVQSRSEAELSSQQKLSALQQDDGHSLPLKGDELPQNLEVENASEQKLSNIKAALAEQIANVNHLNSQSSDNVSVQSIPLNPTDNSAASVGKVGEIATIVDGLAAARALNPVDGSVVSSDKVAEIKANVESLAATGTINPIGNSAASFGKVAEVKTNVDSLAATRAINPGMSLQTNTVNDSAKVNASVIEVNTENTSLQTKAAAVQEVSVINKDSKAVTSAVPKISGIEQNGVQPLSLATTNTKNLSTEEKSALQVDPKEQASTLNNKNAAKSLIQPNIQTQPIQANTAQSVIRSIETALTSSSINSAVQNGTVSGKSNVEIENSKLNTVKSSFESQGVAVNTDKLVNQVNTAASPAVEGSYQISSNSDLTGAVTSNIADKPLRNSDAGLMLRNTQGSKSIDSEGVGSKNIDSRGLVTSNNAVESSSIANQIESTQAFNANNTPAVNVNNGVSLVNDSKSSVEQTANETAKFQNNLQAKRFDPSIAQTQSSLSANTAAVSSPLVVDQSMALNQSLEKMRAGIESSVASDGVRNSEELVKGDKSSIVKSVTASEGLAQLASLQGGLRSTSPVQMQMPPGTPPSSNNWGKAVADKVYIAASQNLRVANIHLDPPELGALQIRLQVTGPDQQMSVAFSSPHASVRDALDQQLPRLREMLEEQGINLGESSVNDQNSNNKQSADSDQQRSAGYVSQNEIEGPANPLNTQGTLSLVDFYA